MLSSCGSLKSKIILKLFILELKYFCKFNLHWKLHLSKQTASGINSTIRLTYNLWLVAAMQVIKKLEITRAWWNCSSSSRDTSLTPIGNKLCIEYNFFVYIVLYLNCVASLPKASREYIFEIHFADLWKVGIDNRISVCFSLTSSSVL